MGCTVRPASGLLTLDSSRPKTVETWNFVSAMHNSQCESRSCRLHSGIESAAYAAFSREATCHFLVRLTTDVVGGMSGSVVVDGLPLGILYAASRQWHHQLTKAEYAAMPGREREARFPTRLGWC